MTVRELIEKLEATQADDRHVSMQIEGMLSYPEDAIWDGECVVLWDGDTLYPVEEDV